jgi:hypothetical protein
MILQLIEKLRVLERQIEAEKGPVNLFAFLKREDIDRWDLVIAAPWARHDDSTLRYIADALRAHLEPVEMVRLARIVILNAAEDPVRSITENYSVEHGRVALRDPELFNLPVTHGYIITSRRAA